MIGNHATFRTCKEIRHSQRARGQGGVWSDICPTVQTVQWGVSLLERKSNTTHEGLIVVASSMEVAPDTRNGPRDSSCFLLEDVTGGELCGEEPRSWKKCQLRLFVWSGVPDWRSFACRSCRQS